MMMMNKLEAKAILEVEHKLFRLRRSLTSVLIKAQRNANSGDYIQTGILLSEAQSYIKTIKALPIAPLAALRYEAPITSLLIEE